MPPLWGRVKGDDGSERTGDEVRIGEAAEATGVTVKTLRFYEQRGLLPAPERAPNGYREYGQSTIARLQFIRRSRLSGLTLAQIGDILRVRDAGAAPCAHVSEALERRLEELDRQIADLQTLRMTVAGYRDAVEAADPAECDAGRICSYL